MALDGNFKKKNKKNKIIGIVIAVLILIAITVVVIVFTTKKSDDEENKSTFYDRTSHQRRHRVPVIPDHDDDDSGSIAPLSSNTDSPKTISTSQGGFGSAPTVNTGFGKAAIATGGYGNVGIGSYGNAATGSHGSAATGSHAIGNYGNAASTVHVGGGSRYQDTFFDDQGNETEVFKLDTKVYFITSDLNSIDITSTLDQSFFKQYSRNATAVISGGNVPAKQEDGHSDDCKYLMQTQFHNDFSIVISHRNGEWNLNKLRNITVKLPQKPSQDIGYCEADLYIYVTIYQGGTYKQILRCITVDFFVNFVIDDKG